jgi:hypothetical protein
LLNLPSDYFHDLEYMYWSTDGFPDMVNGSGAFEMNDLLSLRARVSGFPNEDSVEYLRNLGVRTVVLHPRLAQGTPWQGAETRPTAGLPVRTESRDGVVLYHLAPRTTS